MKLVTGLSEKMLNTSNIWLPPIYRRLLSVDKRESDMSERCLLKIKSTVLPPSLTLSKVRSDLFHLTLHPDFRLVYSFKIYARCYLGLFIYVLHWYSH